MCDNNFVCKVYMGFEMVIESSLKFLYKHVGLSLVFNNKNRTIRLIFVIFHIINHACEERNKNWIKFISHTLPNFNYPYYANRTNLYKSHGKFSVSSIMRDLHI